MGGHSEFYLVGGRVCVLPSPAEGSITRSRCIQLMGQRSLLKSSKRALKSR